MELLLIRHALPQRIENDDGTPADPPLSELGQRQAERLADWLAKERLDALYVSPMRRAVETATPLSQTTGLELRHEPGVVEFDRMSQVYIPLEELKRNEPERWRELVQGGIYAEIDLAEFQRTVIASLEAIVAAHSGQRVAVVCHGGVINTWAARTLGIDQPLFFDPNYTSINRFLAAGSGERSMSSLNEAAHLRGL